MSGAGPAEARSAGGPSFVGKSRTLGAGPRALQIETTAPPGTRVLSTRIVLGDVTVRVDPALYRLDADTRDALIEAHHAEVRRRVDRMARALRRWSQGTGAALAATGGIAGYALAPQIGDLVPTAFGAALDAKIHAALITVAKHTATAICPAADRFPGCAAALLDTADDATALLTGYARETVAVVSAAASARLRGAALRLAWRLGRRFVAKRLTPSVGATRDGW